MEYDRVEVECRSGYKVNEYPVAFTFRDERKSIAEIVDRWYEGGTTTDAPLIDYYKVRTKSDGRVYILMYLRSLDQWFVRY